MKNIILVGNPNVGKTTLFNTLTKSNKKANNWHGVTVDVESKEYKYNGEVFNVSDIPGIYSLDGFSNEEKIACKYLCDNSKDLIVNICDANNLKKNLYLTKHLLEKSYNVILAVNMINEVKNLDLDALEKMFNVKVVGIDARKSKSVEKLKEAIFEQVNSNNNNFNSTTVKRFFANIENFSGRMLTVTFVPSASFFSLYDGNSPSPNIFILEYSASIVSVVSPSKKFVSPMNDATNFVFGFS